MEKENSCFIKSVYRKPIFTGEYIRRNSFCPKKQKTDLISMLVHSALDIYSKSTLQAEFANIRSIFQNNGNTYHVINTLLIKKIRQFNISLHFGPKKCPVYLHLP